MNRQKIMEKIITPEDRTVVARLLDLVDKTLKTHEVEVSDFLDPYQQTILYPVLTQVPGISFIKAGGFPGAERKRYVIAPDYLEPTDKDDRTVVLSIDGNFKFQTVSHRDYLGSILGLGIKREKIGDILIGENGAQVFVDEDIVSYVVNNLTKVHRVSVKVKLVPKDQIILPEEDFTEISATVSSLRLDAVLAAGFGSSRSKLVDEIKSEKVKVNWLIVTDSAFQVHEGDTISLRGKGRVEVSEVHGETKKGRIALSFKKF